MIVSRRDGGLTVVRQVDHQDQCAAMASAWGNGRFARPEPYGPLQVAAALHDEGWRAWEEAPEVRDGAPVDFPDVDRATHVGLYRAGIARAIDADPRAGLLVSLHGQRLYEGRGGLDPGPQTPRADREPAVREFLAEQDDVQRDLRARIGAGEDHAAWEWAAYRLLQTWDALSLYLIWRALPAGREGVLPQVPRSAGDPGVPLRLRPDGPGSCTCDPWPFAPGPRELPVRARTIPDRPYESDDDLREELAAARWETLVTVVRPA
jgi:hypothetical protein